MGNGSALGHSVPLVEGHPFLPRRAQEMAVLLPQRR